LQSDYIWVEHLKSFHLLLQPLFWPRVPYDSTATAAAAVPPSFRVLLALGKVAGPFLKSRAAVQITCISLGVDLFEVFTSSLSHGMQMRLIFSFFCQFSDV
jgi:hypothetical protein